jgi:BAR domain
LPSTPCLPRKLTHMFYLLFTGLLLTSKVVLASPLPRVYEETGGGKVVPVGPAGVAGNSSAAMLAIGGTDFSAEELARISKETGKKLESEVLAPMERWLNAFALVHNRMKKLEALRLEVDSRRRTVSKLGKRVDYQRAQLPQTRARGEYDMENTIKVLQHKEAKLSACRQSYKEHEALVYHQLTNLIRDTVWLKSYLSAVLRVESEAFQVANAALGSMKAALPAPITASEAQYGGGSEFNLDSDSMLPESPLDSDVIPAARGDGQPIRYSNRSKDHGGVSGMTHHTKDSLYAFDDVAALPAAPSHRANNSAGGAYDNNNGNYGVAESNYSRAPMSAW